ncbi:hypothetical protein VIMY103929_02095 [Vibrio mytili]
MTSCKLFNFCDNLIGRNHTHTNSVILKSLITNIYVYQYRCLMDTYHNENLKFNAKLRSKFEVTRYCHEISHLLSRCQYSESMVLIAPILHDNAIIQDYNLDLFFLAE